jgi:hypothetical protein
MMPGLVFILCALTALGCGILLLRGYLGSRVKLLFWSSICFFALSIENLGVFMDMIVFPDVPLTLLRNCIGLAGLLLLIYGFINDV